MLWEPENTLKADGSPYKVFTPFYRKGCLQNEVPRHPISVPNNIKLFEMDKRYSIEDLGLLSSNSWYTKFDNH